MNVLTWIVIGGVVGCIVGVLIRGNQFGRWMDLVMGIAGAIAGGLLMRSDALPGRTEIVSTTLTAILGATLLTALVAFVNARRRYS